MARKRLSCEPKPVMNALKCCKVDALLSVDSRGQLVLPKDVREKAGIQAGDKFVLISHESGGRVCCFSLIRADEFSASVKDMLGPMMKDILEQAKEE